MVEIKGDVHNFGQVVRRINLPDGSFGFQKPRPVYWEWLFFGNSSPLANFFQHREAIFGLTINFENDLFWGTSKSVEETHRNPPSSKQLFGFGYLLGYAYALGIQDLFFENVVRTEYGLQVIDAEVVLSKFFLPQESFLLPFRNCPFERSGLSHLLNSETEITQPILETIVDSFCKVLSEISQNAPKIIEILLQELDTKEVPVRVLLRDTRAYRDWSTISSPPPNKPWLAEELVQLERGDVPYFFKYIGNQELYYFSEFQNIKPVSNYIAFEKGVSIVGIQPKELLEPSRTDKILVPCGVLYLMKTFLPHNWCGEIHLELISIKANLAGIEIRNNVGCWHIKR